MTLKGKTSEIVNDRCDVGWHMCQEFFFPWNVCSIYVFCNMFEDSLKQRKIIRFDEIQNKLKMNHRRMSRFMENKKFVDIF